MARYVIRGKRRTLLTLLVGALMVWPTTGITKTEQLKLEVVDGELVLKTKSKCPATATRRGYPENGCVRADKNDSLTIEFKLSGERRCPAGGSYQLSGVQLAGKGTGEEPKPEQWGNSPLHAVVQNDFDVADAASGWLNVDYSENGNKMTVENLNRSLAGYVIWYRVRATCGDGDNAHHIYYDPRIDNLGSPNT